MQISSRVGEWQIEEFIKTLRKNKIKKGSDDWVKHLVMYGESRGVVRDKPNFSHEAHMEAYKEYWNFN